MNKLPLIICCAILIAACSNTNNEVIDEDKLGIITADVKSDDTHLKEKAIFSDATPGSAETFERSFENAPPMIPHTTEGFLPIKMDNNICITCHMPDVAEAFGATPVSKTHFTDLRPKMVEINGVLQFEDESTISIEELDELNHSYFNCSQCHAPQADVHIDIENLFTPEFREEFGLEKSSLKSKLEEGI